jgi:hypothetical protein
MLNLPSAPHGEQTYLALMSVNSTQAPQSIVQTVAVENRAKRQRLVIGLRLAQMAQQFGPATKAGAVLADFVQGCVDHFTPTGANTAAIRIIATTIPKIFGHHGSGSGSCSLCASISSGSTQGSTGTHCCPQ